MRTSLLLSLVIALGFAAACDSGPAVGSHVNAVSGALCTPDPTTYVPRASDTKRDSIDCQGDTTDIDHPHTGDAPCCSFPQPGCDRGACCDEDLVILR